MPLDTVIAADRLTIKQLRIVCAIERHGSIRVAAESLHLTQPTATKALKEAERTLGVTLFDRSNRGVEPTSYGLALCRRASLIMAELRHVGEDIRELKEGRGGRIVVGTLLAASARLLPAAIARLRANRPGVTVSVVEGTNDLLLPSLRLGDLDLVVGRLPEYRGRAGTEQETLFEEATCMAVRPGHPLAGAKSLTLADTVSYDLIVPPNETTLRRQLDKVFHDAGLSLPPATVESVSLLTNRRLTMETDSISVWPYHVVRQDLIDGTLVRLPVLLDQTSRPVGFTLRTGYVPSPAAAAMIEALRAVGAEIRAEAPASKAH